MKKIYLMLFVMFSTWQINSQVLNQSAGWPNAAWTVAGSYSTDPLAFEFNPTTTANFAFDDDDAGNLHEDNITVTSPVINLTPAFTAGELSVKVDVQYGYRYLAPDVLRFEYWDADAANWVAWSGNLPGNNTTVTNDFCAITKTGFTTPILNIAAFTPTQLAGFQYRIYYDDNPAGTGYNWGFCFNSPVISSIPPPCLTGANYPDTVTVPTTCDGITPTEIAPDSWAGDYFYVTVTSGQSYKFSSSITTDYFTLSTDDGITAASFGTSPLTWISNFTGNLRVHINTDLFCGTNDDDRITTVICGAVCLTASLYPADPLTIDVCDGVTVDVLTTDSWAGEYSNIEVFASNTYTFSSSVPTDYITIATADGATPLETGVGSVIYTPLADGIIRFYFHTNATCGIVNANRERRAVCTTALTVPQCASNPTPADGSTTVPAFATFDLSWDAPTTGDPATSYDLYTGTDSGNLVFEGNITTTTIPDVGPIDAYSTTIYWQIIPRNAAGVALGCTIWSFTTEPQPTDTPDWANLQFPANETITQGGSITVYGQVYEGGLTDIVPNIDGQSPGILAWVGTGATGTNPNTWTNWTVATWNSGHISNNDEYQATIGATLAPGTYDYATRFSLNNGPYVYGGYSPPPGGGFWDGTAFVSGVLTVTPPPVPNNDECAGAIVLTPGGVFSDNDIDDSNFGATLSTNNPAPSCGAFNFATVGKDVWYSVDVPASGNLTIETSTNGSGSGMDTVISVYTGDCSVSPLTAVNCDDDSAPETTFGFTKLVLTGQTPGTTLLLRLFGYNGSQGSYSISAYDGSLGNGSFDSTNFVFYPNPVKNILNLTYNQEISNVEVYNLLGQKVISNIVNANDAQVDMSNLSKGAYMVRVTSNNQVKTIKVIKE